MMQEAATWAAFIALGCGILAGLGVLHSLKRAFALAASSMLFQMLAWMALFMIIGDDEGSKRGDWAEGFFAGFLLSLLYVLPYTVIGSVFSGAVAGLLCRRARQNRVDEKHVL